MFTIVAGLYCKRGALMAAPPSHAVEKIFNGSAEEKFGGGVKFGRIEVEPGIIMKVTAYIDGFTLLECTTYDSEEWERLRPQLLEQGYTPVE